MRTSFLISVVALLSAVSGAQAFRPAPLPEAATLREGSLTLAPLAYLRFCKRYQDECGQDSARQVVALDVEAWQTLRQVNRAVNAALNPRYDVGTDEWELGRRAGDCDDYAVEKRHRLLRAGMPASALSLTEAVVGGVGHLVLTVRTSRGDFVLDNLRDVVLPFERVGYRFIKAQSAGNPDYWVAVDNDAASMVLAQADARPRR